MSWKETLPYSFFSGVGGELCLWQRAFCGIVFWCKEEIANGTFSMKNMRGSRGVVDYVCGKVHWNEAVESERAVGCGK